MESRTHKPFTIEMARDLAKDGEKLLSKGFVKTEGFDKTVVFLMSLTEEIYRITTTHKSFRMELFYDAETLNTNYCFFTSDSDEQGEMDQADRESMDPGFCQERTEQIESQVPTEDH